MHIGQDVRSQVRNLDSQINQVNRLSLSSPSLITVQILNKDLELLAHGVKGAEFSSSDRFHAAFRWTELNSCLGRNAAHQADT